MLRSFSPWSEPKYTTFYLLALWGTSLCVSQSWDIKHLRNSGRSRFKQIILTGYILTPTFNFLFFQPSPWFPWWHHWRLIDLRPTPCFLDGTSSSSPGLLVSSVFLLLKSWQDHALWRKQQIPNSFWTKETLWCSTNWSIQILGNFHDVPTIDWLIPTLDTNFITMISKMWTSPICSLWSNSKVAIIQMMQETMVPMDTKSK